MLPNISFDLWIGLHDTQREFQWVEGEPLRHVSWAPGEPSGCGASSPRDKPVSEVPPWHPPSPGKVSAPCPTMRMEGFSMPGWLSEGGAGSGPVGWGSLGWRCLWRWDDDAEGGC